MLKQSISKYNRKVQGNVIKCKQYRKINTEQSSQLSLLVYITCIICAECSSLDWVWQFFQTFDLIITAEAALMYFLKKNYQDLSL